MPSPLLRLPSLDLVKGFVAVGRRMSITLAADDMCITQSAMSKQIRALEDVLGARLLHRGYRSIALTEAGRRLYAQVNQSLHEMQELFGELSSRSRKPVTITASIGMTGLWLLPRLGAFLEQQPGIDVRVAADNRILDLSADDIDLAIRYCPAGRAPAGAVRLFGETIAPVASPLYPVKDPIAPENLAHCVLIEFDGPRQHPWLRWDDWLAARRMSSRQARRVLHFNQYDQLIHAVFSGQGIALGRLELLSSALASGQLAQLEEAVPAGQGAYAYWLIRADGPASPNVQEVVEWLRREAAATADTLSQPRASRPAARLRSVA